MSEPTDKRLFRGDLIGGIIAIIIMCPTFLFLSGVYFFPFSYLFFILALITIFLGIFSLIMYVTKPNFWRKRHLKGWAEKQTKKNQKKK